MIGGVTVREGLEARMRRARLFYQAHGRLSTEALNKIIRAPSVGVLVWNLASDASISSQFLLAYRSKA